MNVGMIVNPTAGSGTASRRLPEVLRALERAGFPAQVFETEGPGHAGALVDRARAAGVDCLVVMGGDGTLNDVCQGYIDATGGFRPGPDLALVPAGTGGDFRRTFDIELATEAAVARIASGSSRSIDLGIVEVTRFDGQKKIHAFLNITSFGLGGLTDRIVNSSPKWMGGRTAFFLGALRAIVAYKNAPVRVKVDGKVELEAPILNVAIANGRFFGGGMLVAPDADPGDGKFDVVAMHDLTRTQGIALAQHIYKGSHVGRRGVLVARGAMIEAEPLVPGAEVLVDMDGETPGQLPLRAWLVPGALRLRA